MTGRRDGEDATPSSPTTPGSPPGRTAAPTISAAEALARTPLCGSLSTVELARRLADTTRTLSHSQEQVAHAAHAAYGSLPRPAQRLLARAALFAEFDRALLEALIGSGWSPDWFERALDEAAFFGPAEGEPARGGPAEDGSTEGGSAEGESAAREGWYRWLQPSVRQFLLHQLRAEVGERGLAEWRQRAAGVLCAREDGSVEDSFDLLHAARDWRRLADELEARGEAVHARDPGGIEGHLLALPRRLLWARPRLVRLLADCCAAQGKLEEAVETYREAGRHGRAARDGDVAREYHGALVGLYERLGHDEQRAEAQRRLDCLTAERDGRVAGHDRTGDGRGDPAAGRAGRAAMRGDTGAAHRRPTTGRGDTAAGRERGTAQLLMVDVPRAAAEEWRWPDGVVRFAGLCHGALGSLLARCEERGLSWRAIATLATIVATAAGWFLPPLPGLSVEGTRVLASMGALVVLSFLDVLPEYLLGLLLIGAWVVTGTLPVQVATSGFASPTFFLMIASMAIGAAVERSGLLYRGAIELVRRLPPSHAVRCATLGLLGALFSLGIPSVAGRIMLALPLVQDIADSLRYKHRSGGSAGLAFAAYVGFGMMGTLFLTGTPNGLILWGLLPSESQARMNWGMWFLAALPTHVVLLGLTLAFILFWYRPEREDSPPEETLALQRRVLGGLRRAEWSVVGCLALLVLGLSTQALHGVDPAWIAVAAVVALFATGALDDGAFREGVNVSFLVYVGVIIGFGAILAHVELNAWLGGLLGSLTALTGGSQLLFVGAVGIVSIVLSLALRPGPIAILLALSLFGPAQSVGVDAWVVVVAVSLATNVWVYPQQNMLYLTAFYATGERAFSHQQARPLALAYPLFVLVALLASVPYWRWLGLLQ